MMLPTHVWYHRDLPSLFQGELLPRSPLWGPGQPSVLIHLDTVHTTPDLLKLHADLTVSDVAETGRVKEGEERAGRKLAQCSAASAIVIGHQAPAVTQHVTYPTASAPPRLLHLTAWAYPNSVTAVSCGTT